jgi:hypothetical protein
MEDDHQVGFVTIRLERLVTGTRIRLITCQDTASPAPTVTAVYDDQDEALAAVSNFVYGWTRTDT